MPILYVQAASRVADDGRRAAGRGRFFWPGLFPHCASSSIGIRPPGRLSTHLGHFMGLSPCFPSFFGTNLSLDWPRS